MNRLDKKIKKMDLEDKLEAIESLLSSPGWALLKMEFMKRKEVLKDAFFIADLTKPDALKEVGRIQDMHNNIELFYDDVEDVMENLRDEIEESKKEGV